MNKKKIIQRLSGKLAVAVLTGALLLSGCNEESGKTSEASLLTENVSDKNSGDEVNVQNDNLQESSETSGIGESQVLSADVSTLDVSEQFSKRDLESDYDASQCTLITLNGDSAVCDSENVVIENSTVIIKAEGEYLIKGTLKDGSVRVDAPEDAKIRLIFDGVQISCDQTAAVYAKEADKVFITIAEGSTNTITNTGEFKEIDDNKISGAIFSKCDLSINGKGNLIVSSVEGSGIVSKDDLVIADGEYVITAGSHGISGKDSIRIADGNITVTSVKDGLHSGNEEDPDKGYIYIAGGTVSVSAKDDGIHGESKVVIADSIVNILESYEGIEAAVIEIAGGTTSVISDDDGLNATDGSGSSFGPGGGFGKSEQIATSDSKTDICIIISGGKTTIDARGDGIDSNGNLYIKGGETYISGPENEGNGAIDYEYSSEITGGTIIAVGSVGMAMNLENATQGTALLTMDSVHDSGESIQLQDQSGNILLEYRTTCKFRSVVVSCPLMKQGETYTLVVGSEKQEFTLDKLIYGESKGFGGFGGHGGFGGRGEKGDGNRPDGKFTKPEDFDGEFPKPKDFDGEFPKPEDFDGEGMPDSDGEGVANPDGREMPDFDGRKDKSKPSGRQKNSDSGSDSQSSENSDGLKNTQKTEEL